MGLIRIYERSNAKAKKKPGWQKEQAEYEAWLESTKAVKPFSFSKSKSKPAKSPLVAKIITRETPRPPSLGTFGGAGTKPVNRAEFMYRDDPEMLARELAARNIKHNTAPAYNKGGDVYVSPEELTKQLVGSRRR